MIRNYNDEVWFYYVDCDEKVQFHKGTIQIIDKDGTWENPGTPSYDIYAVTDKYPDGCLFKHINESSVFDNLEDLIQKLREVRNDFTNRSSEFQKSIDSAIIKLHNVPNFIGEYIKIDNIYIYVEEVERLYSGIRISGNTVVAGSDFLIYKDDDSSISWEIISKIKILTKEEFLKEINENFLNKVNLLFN